MSSAGTLKSVALVSLAGNAVLFTWLALRLGSSSSRPQPASVPAAELVAKVPASFDQTQGWESLVAGSSAEVAERVRRENFPLSVQRAIVAARLNAEFAPRREAFSAAQAALPYWRIDPEGPAFDPRLSLERRRLKRDFDNQLRATVEPGSSSLTDSQREELQRNYGKPPPEKLEKLHAIQIDYTEMLELLRQEARLRSAPPDPARLAELDRQRLVDLKELLTPPELENFELRNSSTGQRLSGELTAFDFSDDEFRALFRIERSLEERFGSSDGTGLPLTVREQVAMARSQEAQIALGPDRFAHYQLTTTQGYRETSRFVNALDLPSSVTADLLALRREITQRAENAWRNNSPGNALEEMASLGVEAQARIEAKLGPAIATAYTKQLGQWIPKPRGTAP